MGTGFTHKETIDEICLSHIDRILEYKQCISRRYKIQDGFFRIIPKVTESDDDAPQSYSQMLKNEALLEPDV